MHTAPAYLTHTTAPLADAPHALYVPTQRMRSNAETLAQLERDHERGRQQRAQLDAMEERSLAWAMAGLVGGWWLGGPIGAMAGLMTGAIAAVLRK